MLYLYERKDIEKEYMKNILAENMRRFGTKNLNEQDPPKVNRLAPPPGAIRVIPYKVQKGDTLWDIATTWIKTYAKIQTPSDQQIMNFVKSIVNSTNSLKNLNVNDLSGADTEIKNPNAINTNMTLYLPTSSSEILKVYK